MPDDNKDFDSFRKSDGSTDLNRSRQMGEWEASKGYTPSSQQSWETTVDYQNRMRGYDSNKS